MPWSVGVLYCIWGPRGMLITNICFYIASRGLASWCSLFPLNECELTWYRILSAQHLRGCNLLFAILSTCSLFHSLLLIVFCLPAIVKTILIPA